MSKKLLLGILCICFVLSMPFPASAVSPGPTISVLSPIEGAVVSKPSVLVLVQVWDADNPVSNLRRKIDTGAYSSTGIELTSRDCGTNCRIYQYLWDLSAYTNDSKHTIRFIAYNTAGLYQASRTPGLTIKVKAAKTGDGMLMVRNSSSQLCMDCHNIQGHSSQTSHTGSTTPSAYGKWETICLDCHTAHNTTNIDLIRKTVNNYSYLATTAIPEPVRFYNRTGNAAYSYVTSSATGTNITGICQVCHTQTKNPTTLALRWVSTGNPENGHYQDPTENCSNCHLHTEGFRGRDCEQCHYTPPDTGRHPVHGESARYVYGSLVIDSTIDKYGYDCGICHSGTHQNTGGTESNPHTAEVVFAGVAIQDPKGATTGTYAPASFSIFTGVNGYTFNYSEGTCSNTYCHGNYPGSGKNLPITHTEPSPPTQCGTLCHNASNDNSSYPITGSHQRHVTSSARLSGETKDWHTYNREYSCTLCHGDLSGIGTPSSSGAYSSYAVADKTRHVNGYVDWQFSASDSRTKDGFYSIPTGTAVPSDGVTPRAYGYCTIYCHSNVQGNLGFGPPSVYSTMTWTTERNRCTNCHVDPSTAGTGTTQHGRGINTGSHLRHYNDMNRNNCNDATPCLICHKWNSAMAVDYFDACTDKNCNVCHDTLNGTTNEKTKHVNGFINVVIDTFYDPFGAATYNGSGVPGSGYGAGSGSNCSNTYCHSNGRYPKTGVIAPNVSLDWGTDVYRQCYDCHSNTYYNTSDYRKAAPIDDSGTPPNAHQLHLRQSGSTVEDPSCANCHYITTVTNTSIASNTTHMNKFYDVNTGGTYPSWAGSETGALQPVTIGSFTFAYGSSAVSTCTNVSCHPDGLHTNTAMWSNTYYCTECHSVDMDNTEGYHHVMYADALTSRVYPLTAPTSTETDTNRKCIMCHVDHTTFNPMLNANSPGRAYNLRTSIFNSPTPYQYYTNKDFDNSLSPGGICTSCHQNAMTKNITKQKNDNTTTTAVVNKAIFNPSSHNYTVTSTFTSTQSGNFYANCSKCHNTGNDTKTFQNTTPKFATHDNTSRRLLASLGKTTVTDPLEENFCFRCHSKTTDTNPGGGPAKTVANKDYYNVAAMTNPAEDIYNAFNPKPFGGTSLYFMPTGEQNPSDPMPKDHQTGGSFQGGTWIGRSMSANKATVSYETKSLTTTNNSNPGYWRMVTFTSPAASFAANIPAGTWKINIYCRESDIGENAFVRYMIYKWNSADSPGTTIVAVGTYNTEMTTAAAPGTLFTIPVTGVPVSFSAGDKISIDLVLETRNANNNTASFYFGNGADSYLEIPSFEHKVSDYSGLHKPSPTDETLSYISSNKHVECGDCHNTHAARAGNHTVGSNTVGNMLLGVYGATPTYYGTTQSSTLYLRNTNAINAAPPIKPTAYKYSSGTYTTNTFTQRDMAVASGSTGTTNNISTGSTIARYDRGLQFVSPQIDQEVTIPSGSTFTLTLRESRAAGASVDYTRFTVYKWNGTTATPFNTSAAPNNFAQNATPIDTTPTNRSTTFTSNQNVTLYPGDAIICDVEFYHTSGTTPLNVTYAYGNFGTDAAALALPSGTYSWRSSLSSGNWAVPGSYAYKTATFEFEICFKCHSDANTNVLTWGGSGAEAWTDQGLEFNPNNRSGHPVITGLNNYPNSLAPKALATQQMIAPWTAVGTQTMNCSDCHSTSSTASKGPHGSSIKWMLAGTNKAWPYTTAAANGTSGTTNFRQLNNQATNIGTDNGLFCANCHPAVNNKDQQRNNVHNAHYDRSGDPDNRCIQCHIRVPHGGKVSRLISAAQNTANLPARYWPTGTGSGASGYQPELELFNKYSRNSYPQSNACNDRGCYGNEHTASSGESW